MTSRERARAALSFLPVDRPAMDLGSTRVTGMNAWRYRELRRALGLAPGMPRVYDMSGFLAEVEQPVLNALGCDFVMLPLQRLSMGLLPTQWQEHSFWDGSAYLVPSDFLPARLEDGALVHGMGPTGDGVLRRLPVGGRYFARISSTDVEGEDFQVPHRDPRDWRFPEPFTDEFLRAEERAARMLLETTDKSIVATVLPESLGLPHGYGGSLGWAMKAGIDPAHAFDYMQREAAALRDRAAGYLSAVKGMADVVVMSHVDLGSQAGELFNPALFRDLYLPAWKIVASAVHRADPRVKVFIHSCGSVRGFLPLFVEAGIDVLNPVQWTARGMEREGLGRDFGGKIVLWGGGVNTQATFPNGSPEDVRAEVAQSVRLLGAKGGYVLNPGHNIQADVPARNIVAFYEAGRGSKTPHR